MKAIQTEYKGYLFRSRLEARWAVFFDACGVRWEYEPEGFVLDNGQYYLPDFLIHDVDGRVGGELYVEVKGKMTPEDAEKIYSFCGLKEVNNMLEVETPILVVMEIVSATSRISAISGDMMGSRKSGTVPTRSTSKPSTGTILWPIPASMRKGGSSCLATTAATHSTGMTRLP